MNAASAVRTIRAWLSPALGLLALLVSGCAADHREDADYLLHNGFVWTGVPDSAPADALVIRRNRIIAVGGDELRRSYRTGEGGTIDLGGRFVMPGFIDNHVHLVSGGFELEKPELRTAASPKEMAERVAAQARSLPPGVWITGGNWDHEAWPNPRLPTRHDIDPQTADWPVLISRLDGHMALANTRALESAGIDGNTPDPPGGQIVRDPSGEPTGILKDAAMELVSRIIPTPGPREMHRAVRVALTEAARLGITSLNVMASWAEVPVLQTLEREHGLSARLYCLTPLEEWQRLRHADASQASEIGFLRLGALKGFMDGSLGSSTAWLHEPYDDSPRTRGLPSTTYLSGQMETLIREAYGAGFQVAVHAIGDRANDELLTLFEKVIAMNGKAGRRFRIEHAQHLTPDAIARFGRLGVVASMQPYHAIDDGRWAEKRIGPERIHSSYAFRSLLDAGALLTFGSDWPVAPLNPMLGVYAAVTRRTLDGRNPEGWIPRERITVEEALSAYTWNNALAMSLE